MSDLGDCHMLLCAEGICLLVSKQLACIMVNMIDRLGQRVSLVTMHGYAMSDLGDCHMLLCCYVRSVYVCSYQNS